MPLFQEDCDFIGMPKGFDGSMYALGKHVYQFAPRESPPSSKYRTYVSTNNLQFAMMAKSLSYLLLHYFHWETNTIFKKHWRVLMNYHLHALVKWMA